MTSIPVCPECGSTRTGHHHGGSDAVSQNNDREVQFARVLNGAQWREKPLFPPRDRDDLVPND